MIRMTLLDMVKSILSAMVSDPVNSITDSAETTEEALVVAEIIKDTYYELLGREQWDFLKSMGVLDAYGNVDFPNYLVSPVSVSQLRNVRYNVTKVSDTNTKIKDMLYRTPEDFLDHIYNRNSSDSNIQLVEDPSGIPLFIRTDKAPEYYTSFDDKNLVFDSYDNTVDSALQSSKSVVIFTKSPAWEVDDDFIPELPIQMFPLLLAEAKQAAFNYLKQSDSPKDAKRSYRLGSHARHAEKRVVNRAPRQGYGRKK